MSQYDLVSAQTSNVCITRPAALKAIAYIVCVKEFVMSLPAISLGDWFSVSRRVGQGEVGQYINSMAMSEFGCKNPSVESLHKYSWKAVISPHMAFMQCLSVIY